MLLLCIAERMVKFANKRMNNFENSQLNYIK